MFEINNIFRVIEYYHGVQTPFHNAYCFICFFPSEGLRPLCRMFYYRKKGFVFSITVLPDNAPPCNLKDHSKTAYIPLSDCISFFNPFTGFNIREFYGLITN